MPVDEARRLLTESELSAGDVTYRNSPGSEPNRVVSTDPPPGSTVDAGTPVDVVAAA
jgi:beta-lactam-binding protein with PASTA domain